MSRNFIMAQTHASGSDLILEVKNQLKLAVPLILASFLEYGVQLISVIFVGHLGAKSLSSATLAASFTAVTGFSFMFGMGGALETFCGQAYGAKEFDMLGIYMQRGMVILTLLCIPVIVLWIFVGMIFRVFGLPADISTEAGIYARWLCLSIFPYALLQCQVRFLQTQSKVKALTIVMCLGSGLHILGCWLFIYRVGLGSKGAAISIAFSYSFEVLIFGCYIVQKCKTTWRGLSRKGFQDLGTFLRLGIPSAMMMCLDFWAFEVLVLISGHLANPKLETSLMSISLNIVSIVYQFTNGFASAVSTRVANELGAGQPNAAKLAVYIGLFLIILVGIVLNTILIATRGVVGHMFTTDSEIMHKFPSFVPILAVCNFFDGIQGTLAGAARGGGWQTIATYVNLGSYYLVGLPCAGILGFVFHLEGKGLWIGITVGCFMQAIVFVLLVICTNWNKQAEAARERVMHK